MGIPFGSNQIGTPLLVTIIILIIIIIIIVTRRVQYSMHFHTKLSWGSIMLTVTLTLYVKNSTA